MSHGGVTSWSLNLLGTNGTLSFGSPAPVVGSTNVLNDGVWHFAAAVYDGASNRLYVDGSLNNSSAATGVIFGNADNELWLGGDPDHTTVDTDQRYLAGAIAHAAFFTNALSAGAIQQLYDAAVRLNANPTSIQFLISSNGLKVSWPGDHIGWRLRAADALLGLWSDVTGSQATRSLVIPFGAESSCRLIYP